MYQTININKYEEVMDILMEIPYSNDINRYRSSNLYRGLNSASHNLVTTFTRNCKSEYNLEKTLLRNFTKYASLEDPQLCTSIWRQMMIGQHHGLPTRLMDWTHSPLVALHFATVSGEISEIGSKDCVLWKIDMEEMNALLPKKYQEKLKNNSANLLTVDMLSEISEDIDSYDADMLDKAVAFLEPPSIDVRIINQYSYFSIIPSAISNLEVFLANMTDHTVKYIINKDVRWILRDKLDQLNISERMMFPGLDGIASWMKRRYYVNEAKERTMSL